MKKTKDKNYSFTFTWKIYLFYNVCTLPTDGDKEIYCETGFKLNIANNGCTVQIYNYMDNGMDAIHFLKNSHKCLLSILLAENENYKKKPIWNLRKGLTK